MTNIRGSYQSADQSTVIVVPDLDSRHTDRPPELQTRKDLVDFGRTMKTTFKNLLFEDEGEKLLTRIADKRPKVIGGMCEGSRDSSYKYLLYSLYSLHPKQDCNDNYETFGDIKREINLLPQ